MVIDLFGGRASQIAGAINVDIAATSGIRADVTRGLPLASGVADEIIATNPYLRGVPAGSTATNTWLPEATRILRPGGRIIITGQLGRNRFTRVPTAEELQRLGLRLVEEPRAVNDPRIIAQGMFTTDGRPIDVSSLQSFILEKVR
jgi:hypothetical protein